MNLRNDGNVESFTEAVAGALANKVNHLVELTAAGKIQLAQNGIAIGAIRDQMTPGDLSRPVRLLGKNGTLKVVQSAAIAPGARVILDVANPGQVKALPTGTPGTYRSLGIKQSVAEAGGANGAANDVITIDDVVETVIVATAVAAPAAATSVDGAALAVHSTAVNPTKADFDALLAVVETIGDDARTALASAAAQRAALLTAGVVS